MAQVRHACGFCGKDVEPGEIALSIAISGLGIKNGATQGVPVHGGCLEKRLHPSVPFDAEAFED